MYMVLPDVKCYSVDESSSNKMVLRNNLENVYHLMYDSCGLTKQTIIFCYQQDSLSMLA